MNTPVLRHCDGEIHESGAARARLPVAGALFARIALPVSPVPLRPSSSVSEVRPGAAGWLSRPSHPVNRVRLSSWPAPSASAARLRPRQARACEPHRSARYTTGAAARMALSLNRESRTALDVGLHRSSV